ncbi:hypothetical protein Sme01_29020 [Sphaerisporangium melleum]|uniref:Uncharacterized protein n=1 Tax=Sphaerisporangium melleum TaxID=321316 RepID=A0A917VHW0_9ACTN|nr:hypothetical protein GCM10007964_28790 [Sphaerisporangium melleum]GII70426.1 hypothetical protein Sme01_29020 [Sphaerisporangium melleum]
MIPIGIIHWTYHWFSGLAPVFSMVTFAWKPPCQLLASVTAAEHEVGPGGEDGADAGDEAGAGVGVTGGAELDGGTGPPAETPSERCRPSAVTPPATTATATSVAAFA